MAFMRYSIESFETFIVGSNAFKPDCPDNAKAPRAK